MSMLLDLQRDFASAMRLEGDDDIARRVVATPPLPISRRLDIYRNNIAAALIRALEDLYPATRALVGTDFFAQAARGFAKTNPPPHGVLMYYGAEFPEFLEQFPGLEKAPYLPDVARLELAWHRAYIAAEAEPIDARALSELSAEAMAGLQLSLHPSAHLLASDFPFVRIWELASADDEPDAPVDIGSGGEHALVIRPRTEVEVRRLSAGAHAFVRTLVHGGGLTEAATAASAEDADFDLQGHLATFLADGTFCDFHLPDPSRPTQKREHSR